MTFYDYLWIYFLYNFDVALQSITMNWDLLCFYAISLTLKTNRNTTHKKVETEQKYRKRWRQSAKKQKVVPRAAMDFVRQLKVSLVQQS